MIEADLAVGRPGRLRRGPGSRWRVYVARSALRAGCPRIVWAHRACAQGVRDHIRNCTASDRRHRVAGQRAHADRRRRSPCGPIQVWVRTAGVDRRQRPDAAGHRLESRRRVRQGRSARPRVPARSAVVDVSGASHAASRRKGDRVGVTVDAHRSGAAGQPAIRARDRHRGDRAPLGPERSDHRDRRAARRLRARTPSGSYAQREIQTGLQGELFTEIPGGLKAGEQVVTFGSFFIDADHKLKGS